MKQKVSYSFIILLLIASHSFSQSAIIRGRVFNAINNEPIEFATVGVEQPTFGTTTDSSGHFEIKGLASGLYNLQVSSVGFKPKTIF